MLDDAEILVVLEYEPGVKERVVELFRWIGECKEWKISTPAVVEGEEERVGRETGASAGRVGIWAV